MGFGHRVYKNYDPRAKIMQKTCHEVLDEMGIKDDPLLEVALELEKIALNDPYFVEKKLYPNIDFYSGITLKAMGFPTTMFTVLFAVARTVGWIASGRRCSRIRARRSAVPGSSTLARRDASTRPSRGGSEATRSLRRCAKAAAEDADPARNTIRSTVRTFLARGCAKRASILQKWHGIQIRCARFQSERTYLRKLPVRTLRFAHPTGLRCHAARRHQAPHLRPAQT